MSENLGIERMIEELRRMNPEITFRKVGIDSIVIIGINPRCVKYPEGYYYSPISGITNKYNRKNTDVEEAEYFKVIRR